MIRRIAKWIVFRNPFRKYLSKRKIIHQQQKELLEWETTGKISSPPDLAKQNVIREYSKVFNTKLLIETGTYFGDMVVAMRNHFSQIYSIELSYDLYKKAKLKFKGFKHINIIHGDSSIILEQLLPEINESALFWLDGHYSGEITAKGKLNTPILDELKHIFNNFDWHHIILIDDARVFGQDKDYPEINYLKNYVLSFRPDARFEIKDDIIRIT